MPARIPITRNGVPTWEETRVPIDTPDLIGPDFSDQILVELVRSGRIERYAYQRRRWGKFTAYRLAVTADPSGPRDSTGAKSKRGRRKAEKQLTEKQTQAVHIVGDCKGNFTEAARRLGCAPKTVRQHYQAAMRKLGKRVTKAATHALPSDRRGQESVSADRRKD